jgi:hypothetical protein
MTWTTSHRWASGLLGLTLVSASEVRCQALSSDPTPAEVAAFLRSRGQAGPAIAVLTQLRVRQSEKKMDDVADSLAAIAIGFPGTGYQPKRTRMNAQIALLEAGMGRTGIPYSGARDRLMRIVEESQDIGVRASALFGLMELPNRLSRLPLLKKVATSRNPIAYRAVIMLTEIDPEGRAIARELYQSGGVVDSTANETLHDMAGVYKWR